jgi:ATP-binding protein involved in chromosome partitioning
VDRVVAVGSGKGGVGKSTVAVNLALALRERGLRAGLLDADIYGPSTLALLGMEDAPERAELTEDRRIVPLEALGMPVVSFGFFLGEKSPAVWRGPLVAKAVDQVSRGVVWPELEVLVVDLPPGTGDVPLSLTGAIRVDGGLVVTTPQQLAVSEAHKCARMFGSLEVPLLGVVENMSHATCRCGEVTHPFGEGGGRRLSEEVDAPLLARVPLDPAMRSAEERGVPVVADAPGSEGAGAFRSLAEELPERLAQLPRPSVGRDGEPGEGGAARPPREGGSSPSGARGDAASAEGHPASPGGRRLPLSSGADGGA